MEQEERAHLIYYIRAAHKDEKAKSKNTARKDGLVLAGGAGCRFFLLLYCSCLPDRQQFDLED
jgi:hypothetical protein